MRGAVICLLMLICMLVLFLSWMASTSTLTGPKPEPYIYSNLLDDLAAQKIKRVEITGNLNSSAEGSVQVYFNDTERAVETLEALDLASLMEKLNAAKAEYGLEIDTKKPAQPSVWAEIIPFLIVGVGLVILIVGLIILYMRNLRK